LGLSFPYRRFQSVKGLEFGLSHGGFR
jgi:hypothetical protein